MGTEKKYSVIDLFCGCGGLSRGLEATGRFTSEFGVELLEHPAKAYSSNIRNSLGFPTHCYTGDIRALLSDKAKLRAELKAAGLMDGDRLAEVDVLAGGPPCNGFSRNGVRQYSDREVGERFYDDPRNHLYKAFLEFCELINPKAILIENVREFLNYNNGSFSSDLINRLDEIGYYVEYEKLCAADYGVPQLRNRVFFLAVRKDILDRVGEHPGFPEVKFSPLSDNCELPFLKPYRTVADAIADLPSPTYNKGHGPLSYLSGNISDYATEMRSETGCVYNHMARKLSDKSLARVRAVGTGRMKDIDPKLRTREFYGSAYRRLAWHEPALTITTWVYHVGSGRFAHPEEDRGLTMREAARLQSFDDDFIFPPLINPVSQMIGNAVPPIVARELGKCIVGLLDAYDSAAAAA